MKRLFLAILIISTIILTACGGGAGSTSSFTSVTSTTPTGTVYMTGSDAPLPSVLAFQLTVNSLTLSNATSSVALITEPTTIEFSRLLGLRTLLALNSVPAGTYDKIAISISAPVISYLNISANPATVGTINGTLTATSGTFTLPTPLTVGANGLAGFHFHFNLRDSIGVDSVTGQITGTVNPHMMIRPLSVGDDDAQIDELRGAFVSADVAHNTFVMQRIHGRDVTIRVNTSTVWDGTDSINTLSSPATVEVSGKVQADGSILADQVQVITRDKGFVSGLVLGAQPLTGAADSFTLLVREEMPGIAGVDVGKPATLSVVTATRFDIYAMRMPVEAFLFNRSQLVVGQRVSVGGLLDTTTTPATFSTRRVVLHRQGLEGKYAAGSLVVNSGNVGEFKIAADGLFGYLFGAPVKVVTSANTRFLGGLTSLSDVASTGTSPIFVVGLLLKDGAGNPVFVAQAIGKPAPSN